MGEDHSGEDRGIEAVGDLSVGELRAKRRAHAMAEAVHRGVGALLVTKPANIRYLTGFSGSSATLLLGGGTSVLATDGRYTTQAHAEVDGAGEDIRLVITRDDDWLQPAVMEMLHHHDTDADASGGGLGVEADDLTLARGETIRGWDPPVPLQPLTGVVEALRQRKDTGEMPLLARACRITAESFDAMYGWLAPGMTERHVAHRLLGEMIERGADGPAFEFIVASGVNGARPHHHPTSDAIGDGAFVTVDAGARVAGYHADMTRTVAVGRAPGRMGEVYEVVAQAQARGVQACISSAAAGDIDAACRGFITDAGYGDEFTHPTGHGVGLEIHEAPILSHGQAATLASGMAVTVEPGIYLPGLGGVRIEDVVAITDDAPVPLTVPSDRTAQNSGSAARDRAPQPLIEL